MTRIQFITHENEQYTYLEGAQYALEGGCRWIQLRMKDKCAQEVISIGLKLRDLCNQYQATLIIDDHVELVEEIGADGVHLGQSDMPIDQARGILGGSKIIGGTANTLEQIRRLYHLGADYIGCGPYRYTQTKKNLAPIIGLEGYENFLIYMSEEDIHVPLIAIGGIRKEDVSPLMQTGISGIAISSAILNAPRPKEEMELLIQKMAPYEKSSEN